MFHVALSSLIINVTLPGTKKLQSPTSPRSSRMLQFAELLLYHSMISLISGPPLLITAYSLEETLDIGDLLPFNPTAEEGDDLVMNCSIHQNHSSYYYIRDVVFEVGDVEYAVNDPNVHVVSDSMISLTCHDVTPNMTHTMVTCLIRDEFGEDTIGYQTIEVVRRPIKPEVDCIVHNWSAMACLWKPTEEEQRKYTGRHDTNVTFLWADLNDSDMKKTCDTTGTKNNCTWTVASEDRHPRLRLDGHYSVKVSVETVHTTLTTDWVHFSPLDIVMPDAVSQVETVSLNSTTVGLQWLSPNDKYGVQYLLSYRSEWDQSAQWQNVTLVKNHVSLSRLSPYTVYDVRVTAKPIRNGFWSDVIAVSFKTSPEVPRINPRVITGGFHMLGECGGECRKVAIFWQAVSDQDRQGPGLQYEVQHRPRYQSDWLTHTVSENTSRFVIQCTAESEEVRVTARNGQGRCDQPPDSVVISSAEQILGLPEIDFQALALNDSVVSVSWTLEDETDPDHLTVTVVWCQGHTRQEVCQGPLSWLLLPGNETNHTIWLPDGATSNNYLFGTSVNVGDVSSGVFWADCLYHHDAEPVPPERLRFSPDQNHGSLTVQWSVVTCDDSPALILAYTVYSCVTTDSETCSETEESRQVPPTEDHYTLTGLRGGRTYLVWMDSVSYTGHSSPSQTIQRQTTETWASPGIVTVIVVVVMVADILVIVGCIGLMIKVRRCRRLLRLEIRVPDKINPTRGSVSTSLSVGYRRRHSNNSYMFGDSTNMSPVTLQTTIWTSRDSETDDVFSESPSLLWTSPSPPKRNGFEKNGLSKSRQPNNLDQGHTEDDAERPNSYLELIHAGTLTPPRSIASGASTRVASPVETESETTSYSRIVRQSPLSSSVGHEPIPELQPLTSPHCDVSDVRDNNEGLISPEGGNFPYVEVDERGQQPSPPEVEDYLEPLSTGSATKFKDTLNARLPMICDQFPLDVRDLAEEDSSDEPDRQCIQRRLEPSVPFLNVEDRGYVSNVAAVYNPTNGDGSHNDVMTREVPEEESDVNEPSGSDTKYCSESPKTKDLPVVDNPVYFSSWSK